MYYASFERKTLKVKKFTVFISLEYDTQNLFEVQDEVYYTYTIPGDQYYSREKNNNKSFCLAFPR